MNFWNESTKRQAPWLTYRGIATPAFALDPLSRKLVSGQAPLWRVVSWVLGPQETEDYRVTTGVDFYLAAILGSSALNPSFQARIYDSKRKRVICDMPLNSLNLSGSAERPFFFRRVYEVEPNTAILMRIQNLNRAANSGQVVLFGFGRGNQNFEPNA